MLKYVEGFRDRKWAVEGASGMGRSVAQHLVRAGETVVDVPAKLAAQIRVYATGHGRKTDPTDAISIAKAALRSKRPRPVLVDDDLVALKLLVDRRKELVGMRVQSMCRLHRLLRLKRRISDAVYQRLRADHVTRAAATPENPPKWPSMKTRPASFRSKATPRTKPHPPRKTATTNNIADRVRGVASNKTGPTGASPARPRPTSPKRPKLPTSNPPS